MKMKHPRYDALKATTRIASLRKTNLTSESKGKCPRKRGKRLLSDGRI
jgi:hypothetical protein